MHDTSPHRFVQAQERDYDTAIPGRRLVASVKAILAHAGRNITEILDEVDALKFRSCLTLFASAASHEACFSARANAAPFLAEETNP